MRIVRVDVHGNHQYGVLDGDDVRLLEGTPFTPEDRERVTASVAVSDCRLLPPVNPTKIIAIGRNYAAHAAEMGHELGAVPSVFMKPPQTLVAHGGTVVLPPRHLSSQVEHEGELAIVIGRGARNVRRADAQDYILGFTCADDVSARDLQRNDPQLTRAKGFDTFCPLGPHVETDVSIEDDFDVTCTVNGQLRQSGNTRDLLFDIPTLIEHLTEWTTLAPGDVILTGSPAGTAALAPGDEVEVAVSGVGVLQHVVAAGPEDERR